MSAARKAQRHGVTSYWRQVRAVQLLTGLPVLEARAEVRALRAEGVRTAAATRRQATAQVEAAARARRSDAARRGAETRRRLADARRAGRIMREAEQARARGAARVVMTEEDWYELPEVEDVGKETTGGSAWRKYATAPKA
jgi:hypothetical protein